MRVHPLRVRLQGGAGGDRGRDNHRDGREQLHAHLQEREDQQPEAGVLGDEVGPGLPGRDGGVRRVHRQGREAEGDDPGRQGGPRDWPRGVAVDQDREAGDPPARLSGIGPPKGSVAG